MASGGMPYVIANNPVFTVLESVATRKDRLKGLKRLVDGDPMWKSPAPGASTLDHLRQHWFGFDSPGPVQVPGSNPPRLPLPPKTPFGTTGWWANWYGDAHEVVRQTLQRLYQVSLRIDEKDLTATKLANIPEAGWEPGPIRIVWLCGAPMLQGFVFTDQDGGAFGIIATPHVEARYFDPLQGKVIGPMSMVERVLGPEVFHLVGADSFTVGHTDGQDVKVWVWPLLGLNDPHLTVAQPPAQSAASVEIRMQQIGTPLMKYSVLTSSGPVITAHLDVTPPSITTPLGPPDTPVLAGPDVN